MGVHQDIIHFVKGMALHDITKPLFLSGSEHSLAGFAIMSALYQSDQALAILLSHNMKKNLGLLFGLDGMDKLSFLHLLAGSIDQLAASTYEVAGELNRNELKYEPPQSCQNPFSHLPARNEELGSLTEISKSNVKLDSLFQKDFQGEGCNVNVLNKEILILLIKATKSTSSNELAETLLSLRSLLQSDPEDCRLLQDRLQRYQRLFPERTYPTPNDTALKNHCRLAAVLAFVICSNLNVSHPEFLQKKLHTQNSEIKLGSEEIDNFINQTESAFGKIEEIVRDNSDCFILQVSFSGYKHLIPKFRPMRH